MSVSAPSGSSFAVVVLLFEATYFLELLVWVVLRGHGLFCFWAIIYLGKSFNSEFYD